MPDFKQTLSQLPPIDGIAAIELVDEQGGVVATIPNAPGKQGSLAVYNSLREQFGVLDQKAARAGLELFCEHTADARENPGKHPNIDLLLSIIAEQGRLNIRLAGQ